MPVPVKKAISVSVLNKTTYVVHTLIHKCICLVLQVLVCSHLWQVRLYSTLVRMYVCTYIVVAMDTEFPVFVTLHL